MINFTQNFKHKTSYPKFRIGRKLLESDKMLDIENFLALLSTTF